MTAARHRWLLTAPWYRWPSHDPAAVRASAPALQAFALPTFIAEFLREPQRSLVDHADDHDAHVRKLFRPQHRRFYIVACELRCDVAGLPPVDREQVCEAGFEIHPADSERPANPPRANDQDHRLYPLVPPPDAGTHSARGRSLFFGAVPAHGFAATQRLVIRCFVRRHRAGCPRKSTTPDCHGELVWSNPSETFRVAAPQDPDGLAHDRNLVGAALRRDDLPAAIRDGSLKAIRDALGVSPLGDTARATLEAALAAPVETLDYHTPKAPPA
jgi:hypothetical protein